MYKGSKKFSIIGGLFTQTISTFMIGMIVGFGLLRSTALTLAVTLMIVGTFSGLKALNAWIDES